MFKNLLTKTLLVAAALCAGSSVVWGDITYNYTLVDQDFSDVASESTNWSTASGMTLAQTLRSGTDYYYTMSFGNSGNVPSTADYNLPSLTSYDAYKISFLWGMYSCSASNRNSLFKIVGASADLATTNNVAGNSSYVTLTANETATTLDIDKYNKSTRDNANRTIILYKITVEGVNIGESSEKGVWMTITSEDGLVSKLARTKIADYTTVTKLHFESGQFYGQNAIDDILVQAYSSVEVVPDPSAQVTGVNGTARTITMTLGENSTAGTSIKYYTTVDSETSEPEDLNTYSEPFQTSTAGTIYYYSESATGTKSNIKSIETGAGVTVSLATPSVSVTSVTVKDGYLLSPVFVIYEPNNSAVLLTPPTETLAYTFTPDGGTESARTTISSGTTYSPTENGVLKVYASTTGYKESVFETPVSNYYALSSSSDYTNITPADVWTDQTEAWSRTAYRVVSSGTWSRLNIRNENTIDYIPDFGFARKGNTYTYRIRNSVKGQIYVVTQTSVSDSPALSYQQVLCKSGTGKESDVQDFASAVASSLAVKQIDFYAPATLTEVLAAILDCKAYDTSAAFATAIDAETFTSAAEVYAFNTTYQIENGTLTNGVRDITKAIRNAAITDATDWAGARVITLDQQYTGAPDNVFIDANNQVLNTNQTVYGVPAGTYIVKAATRADVNMPGTLYVSDGTADVGKIDQITNIGNTGGDLGNGWSFQEMEFTLTESKNLLIGFWTNAANGWAGCDDWHMYRVESVGITVPDGKQYTTFNADYALDFTNVTDILAYTAAVSGSDVTLTKVTGAVPAHTGLLIRNKQKNGAAVAVPVATSAEAPTTNDFVAVTEAQTIKTGYVLATVDGVQGFYPVNSSAGTTIAAGKAYLPVGNGARLSMVFDDEATGISAVERSVTEADGAFYNLKGQRVAAPTKGIFIKNGKKIIVK